jgi:hypothetical protein
VAPPGGLLGFHKIIDYPVYGTVPVVGLTGLRPELHVPELEEVTERGRHHDLPLDLAGHIGDQAILLGVAGYQAQTALGVIIGKCGGLAE